ncbi:pyridoxal phosphate-dependent aminotransferase [Candidatus Marinamargulisbacteria bacterium SCGC AG-343-D04]|nr:pyridoxal phosphate-dependent aminotransferase [Candidatus Marinamargulisbacteria bacterium SCGC AG-343-D04]
MTDFNDYLSYFKEVPKTGVIYVLEQATEMGYRPHLKEWANLGQGAPDTASLTPKKRDKNILIDAENSEYSPVGGDVELRKRIAAYYNTFFRKDSLSKYTYKNVCIAGGGRIALARVIAALGTINLGHFIPDYTAYEELLGVFKEFVSIPILLSDKNCYKISIEELRNEIVGRGLSALLLSNPSNPTGQLIKGDDLKQWIDLSRELRSLMIIDEFYSHYIYDDSKDVSLVSASEFIHDVNHDPVLIINGLSKNWRSPGWRVGWVVGPEEIIERVSSVGSFIDGGAAHPMQKEALNLLSLESVETEAKELQKVFSEKRTYMLKRLKKMGFTIECDPESTFYVWCNISSLPHQINDCTAFFKECLKENVIVVPGIFFDVNPGRRRLKHHSRYNNYIRVSFGPSMDELKVGLDSIQRVINKFK